MTIQSAAPCAWLARWLPTRSRRRRPGRPVSLRCTAYLRGLVFPRDPTLARRAARALVGLVLLSACSGAWAFDLQQLQTQLRATPVVRGAFVQQKFLRGLPQPLTSEGQFTLATHDGLLWQLRTPIAQTLRITPDAIARRDPAGAWQTLPGAAGNGRQSRLFMAVLSGDTSGLRENFDIALSGTPEHWQLALRPTSPLLKQIFSVINIEGGKLVDRIELSETQGDRTVLQMKDARSAQALDPGEADAFRH